MGVFASMDNDGSKCIDKQETLKFWFNNIEKILNKNKIYIFFYFSKKKKGNPILQNLIQKHFLKL